MAELNPTTQCSNSPCLFFYSSGSFNDAPVNGFRELCVGDRALFVLTNTEPKSWPPSSLATSGSTVTIESRRVPKFRVTTSDATGRLTAPAECQ